MNKLTELTYYEDLIYQYTGIVDKDKAKKLEEVCLQCAVDGCLVSVYDILNVAFLPTDTEFNKLIEEINKQPVYGINTKNKNDKESKVPKKLRNGWV